MIIQMAMIVSGASWGALFILLPSNCLWHMLGVSDAFVERWPRIIIHQFLRKEF